MDKIRQIQISSLKDSEYNPRQITKDELKKLEKSVKEFGMVQPIVVNANPERENIVISGHQRLEVAKRLGMKEVPCMLVDLDLNRERALNLAMNKIGGRFEEEKLIDLLTQIEQDNEDILNLTGFDNSEINYLLALKEKEKEQIYASSTEDDFDLENKYSIQEGDIVILDGKHRIICGDATDPKILRNLLGENKVDLLVTSPPYNLDIKYGKYRDNKDYKEYIEMIKSIFDNVKTFLNRGRFICVNIGREWGPINMPAKYDEVLERLGFIFFRNIYWSKPSGSARGTITNRNPFPRYYIPKVQTEIIQIYSNEEKPEIYDTLITYKFGEDKREKKEQIPSILLNKYAGNVWEMMTETNLGGNHPAPFPTQLPFNCIRFFTFENEIILDPFLGSGTSIIASDQLKRKGYGIELDPNYVSLVIERYLFYKPAAKFEVIKKVGDKKI